MWTGSDTGSPPISLPLMRSGDLSVLSVVSQQEFPQAACCHGQYQVIERDPQTLSGFFDLGQ